MAKCAWSAWALALIAAPEARAHDYWLQPDSFGLDVGKKTAVRLHVGERLTSEAERPFQSKPMLAFQWIGARETKDLKAAGREGETPVALVSASAPGNYLLRLDRGPSYIKLGTDKFHAYLAEEGLAEIIELRRKSGEDKRDGRERYSRCLKALLQAGGSNNDVWKKTVGQSLEIVPLSNPFECKPGAKLTVRVLLEGKPLAKAKLSAHCRSASGAVETQTALTAADGAATIALDRSGVWLVRLVHMRRCTGDPDADWESFWSAYTFAIAGAQSQNPSPMVEHTRPHPRLKEERPPGKRATLKIGTLFLPEKLPGGDVPLLIHFHGGAQVLLDDGKVRRHQPFKYGRLLTRLSIVVRTRVCTRR